MRRQTVAIIGGLVALVVMVAVGWYLFSPLLFDTAVNEDLTFAAAGTPTPDAMVAASDVASNEEAVDAPKAGNAEPVAVQETAAAMPDKEMAEAMPAGESEPVALRSGEFVDADSFHKGAGTATIYDLPDGRRVLRLEDFEVTNGPDLHVLLATGEAPTGRDDIGDYLDLGKLKGNIGNQNYDLPADIDISQYQSVVIYCEPFHVVFSTATLN